MYNKLNLGGLLCIAVPNDYSPFQTAARQTLKYKPWWVGPPQHINYFDFSSLEKILTKYGFTVLLKESTFPIDMFLLMGENYIDNDKVGRKCHGMVKEFEKRIAETGDKSLKNKLYQKFAELNIGREAIIYAQKNATEKVFCKKKLHFRSFEIKRRNEEALGELFCFFILETIVPLDSTSMPPTKIFLGFNFTRSSKTKMSASFPGAIPPKSDPIL